MIRLCAYMDGRRMGWVSQEKSRLNFEYADTWRSTPGAYPLSTAMPLVARDHGHAQINAFLWGLLPDNEQVLQRWARRFQVSARNPFALLSEVGEDCAGAVQFVPEAHENAFLEETGGNAIEWLTENNIGERLRALQQDASAGRAPRDTGQFSLAGAQPKTALYWGDGRWGVPHGRMPTTHILKPPTGVFDGFAENEHFCLGVARALGLPAARSRVMEFDGATAIVVERFDRQRVSELVKARRAAADHADSNKQVAFETGHPYTADDYDELAKRLRAEADKLESRKGVPVLRAHQEDICQALSILPSDKYQSEGGPSPIDIIDHLRAHGGATADAEADVWRFVDALIFNWLIGGTDAHAKNYSLLIGAGGRVRLAPLYDLSSILAYRDIDPRKVSLAMKIGDAYKLSKITSAEWIKFAQAARLEVGAVIERIHALAEELPDAMSDVLTQMRSQHLDHPILSVLDEALRARAKRSLIG
ncbi:MAG: type II toxin-antitoxin system HipA family toxin [Pseudomonadota bacterium]